MTCEVRCCTSWSTVVSFGANGVDIDIGFDDIGGICAGLCGAGVRVDGFDVGDNVGKIWVELGSAYTFGADVELGDSEVVAREVGAGLGDLAKGNMAARVS